MRPALVLMLLAAPAAADHEHHHVQPGSPGSLIATAGALAARYESLLFDGDYQGLTGAATYARGRFAFGASGATYRLQKNGKIVHGPGDTHLFAQANLAPTFGVTLAVMLPTGDDAAGLGMGHVMLMPAAFAQITRGDLTVTATSGYAHGIGDQALHAQHGGAWPLVEPMAYQEVTFGGTAMLALARELSAGVRLTGAAPIGDGTARLAAGVRAVWVAGRVETGFELAVGIAGDPFRFRGTLASAIRF